MNPGLWKRLDVAEAGSEEANQMVLAVMPLGPSWLARVRPIPQTAA
jgi:hypothetical protein